MLASMHDTTGDINLVEKWITLDKSRLKAGVMAGLTAGVIALVVAAIGSVLGGGEPWIAFKAAASLVLGTSARDFGFHAGVIGTGFVVFEAVAVFFGLAYAHFVRTNAVPALFGMGLTWGAFSWVFIHNLLTPAWRAEYFVDQISPGSAFFFWMAYGLGLMSIRIFDRR